FTLIDWEAMLARPRVSGLVSLVMPSFNRVGMTEKFLNSILSATRGKLMFEVIVVDNGSKPEVRDQIRRLDGVDPRVKVVCTTAPLMFAVGCNYGASFARGEYILFVNNDMEAIEANWLDSLIAPLQASPTIGITGGMLLFEDRTVQHAGLVFSDRSNFAYHAYLGHDPQAEYVRKMRRMQAVTGACMAMRASDWAKLRGFNPLYLNGCEDVDLCLRMKSVLKRDSLYVPDSVLIHYEGKTPGRGRYIIANRKIFSALWAETFVPDDQALYKSDGIEEVYHQSNDEWLAPGLQTVSVSFETRKTMEAAAP
nr:glycosyltransferase family 2 protein [Pseudomonas sp.]